MDPENDFPSGLSQFLHRNIASSQAELLSAAFQRASGEYFTVEVSSFSVHWMSIHDPVRRSLLQVEDLGAWRLCSMSSWSNH